jgi:periplasmic divalent cation tolerance protein
MTTEMLLIYCNCPDRECAEQIANHLLDQSLAACISIIPPVTSIYQWQGKREVAEESMLLIKSSRKAYDAVEQAILTLHPYELPEIVAVSVELGLPGYLQWDEQCTTEDS